MPRRDRPSLVAIGDLHVEATENRRLVERLRPEHEGVPFEEVSLGYPLQRKRRGDRAGVLPRPIAPAGGSGW